MALFQPKFPLEHPTYGDDRSAMGYPPYYQETRYYRHDQLAEPYRGSGHKELTKVVSDPMVSIAERLGAATRLNQIDDPRIEIGNPEMVLVPGGEISIGIDEAELESALNECRELFVEKSWLEKEVPKHLVNLDPYKMSKFPVTNMEFRTFLLDTEFPEIPSSWAFGRYPEDRGNHPVFSVSIEAAKAYSQWLSHVSNKNFRLPTENEWEYAAAGPDRLVFPWGNKFDHHKTNTIESAYLSTTPVGLFPNGASPFGVLDMAGNVEEWVSDRYRPYKGGSQIDDDLTITFPEGYPVLRGGSFTRFRDLARTTRRHGKYPRDIYVSGFRVTEIIQ